MDRIKAKELRVFAEEIRVETLKTIGCAGFGHVGGAMSIVETVAVLYGDIMKYDPKNPGWQDRDKLILSKGHAGPTLYAVLAMKGFFPKEMLTELNKGGGRLPSHVDRNKTLGIDMTAGSLGQGLSVAAGVALGDRMDGRASRTFVIVGDGELDEGQNWEGIMFAKQFKLDNLICLVDANGQQLDGYTKDIMDLGSIADKLRSFGWNTQDVDGHDISQIYDAIIAASDIKGIPSAIILHTKKGHGCTFAEGVLANHHINFKCEQIDEALEAAQATLEKAKKALYT